MQSAYRDSCSGLTHSAQGRGRLAILCLIVISLVSLNPLYSQVVDAGYSESYLLRNTGARAISMAGAYNAIVNDPTCLFYNPAGLSNLDINPMINTTYSVLQYGRTQSVIAWGQSISERIAVGFGINNFTTGSFIARDIKGNPIGKFTDWQFALVAGASYKSEFNNMGISVKYLSNSLQGSGTSAKGFGVDIGSQFNIMDMFSVGITVQNIAGVVWWNTPSEETNILPYIVRLGVAWEYGLSDNASMPKRSQVTGEVERSIDTVSRYILFGIDAIAVQHESAPTIVFGTELVPHEVIAFRAGIALAGDDQHHFKLFPMTVWGAGVSIRPRKKDIDLPFKTMFDYTISKDLLAANKIAHHISIGVNF